MKKAFTIIELVVAVGVLAMVLSFSGLIFKVSIESHRTAQAGTEIMQNLRAITNQLNQDFQGLAKEGYLILRSETIQNRQEYESPVVLESFRSDRLYYFSTGDFCSWFPPGARTNIARVYFGHDSTSLHDTTIPVSQWNLARDVMLITPYANVSALYDCTLYSFAELNADVDGVTNNADRMFYDPNLTLVPIAMGTDSDDARRLFCENAGELVIEWTDGRIYTDPIGSASSVVWFGLGQMAGLGSSIEEQDLAVPPLYYSASWRPDVPRRLWPKAIKFTFRLYDSKGIIEGGRQFTHIVYLEE